VKKLFLLSLFIILSYAKTIKDLSNIVGIRDNQLVGYGLVVGLNGTGDKSGVAMQSLKNLLQNAYLSTQNLKSKNIASVMVTATLPAFARQGDKIIVQVSSIGDAKSLSGGQLLLTRLKGMDGKIYAVAQGIIIENPKTPTTGYIYNGATVENEIDFKLSNEKSITLSLKQDSADVALLCETQINDKFQKRIAFALDTRTIKVNKPEGLSTVRFLSEIQKINIQTDVKDKIIIDPVKEMIIAGADIIIKPITISREKFTLRIKKSNMSNKAWNDPKVNKGLDLGDDTAMKEVLVGPINVAFDGTDNSLANFNSRNQPTISDLMKALRILKIPMSEVIDTIKMLDKLGAIDAEVEIVK
jgi:flagellar P-ring protein precursor FlgI